MVIISQHNERILVNTELSTSVSLEHCKIFLLLLFNLALFLEWNIMISGVVAFKVIDQMTHKSDS